MRIEFEADVAKIFYLLLTLKIFLHNQRTQNHENSQEKYIV